MSANWLTEKTIDLLLERIKATIGPALVEVRAQRGDSAVTTEAPNSESYFIYEGAKGYRCPAVFCIADEMDIMNAERGANFIAARSRVIVSVLVEDRLQKLLTRKAWRYQSALFKILHLASLTSTDSKVRIESKVSRVVYSPEFSDATNKDVPSGVFRKEVALHLDVEHFENL